MRYQILFILLVASCAANVVPQTKDEIMGVEHHYQDNYDAQPIDEDSGIEYSDVLIRFEERLQPKHLFPRDYVPDPAPY